MLPQYEIIIRYQIDFLMQFESILSDIVISKIQHKLHNRSNYNFMKKQ